MPAKQLDPVLQSLAREATISIPDDFMERVWERAGAMDSRRERRARAAIFVGLFAVGLGAGVSTVQAPLYAQETRYTLADNTALTPSALLHLDR